MVPKFNKTSCTKCGAPTDVINGAWLREQRNRAGMSLRGLGAKIGFSTPFLSDVELGRRGCSQKVRKAYEALKSKGAPHEN